MKNFGCLGNKRLKVEHLEKKASPKLQGQFLPTFLKINMVFNKEFRLPCLNLDNRYKTSSQKVLSQFLPNFTEL